MLHNTEGKGKGKQEDTTQHLLERPDSTPNAGGHSNTNSLSLLLGTQNGAATSEDSLVFFYKAKHNFTIQSSNCTPWHLSKRAEELMSHDTLHADFIPALFITVETWKQPRRP